MDLDSAAPGGASGLNWWLVGRLAMYVLEGSVDPDGFLKYIEKAIYMAKSIFMGPT